MNILKITPNTLHRPGRHILHLLCEGLEALEGGGEAVFRDIFGLLDDQRGQLAEHQHRQVRFTHHFIVLFAGDGLAVALRDDFAADLLEKIEHGLALGARVGPNAAAVFARTPGAEHGVQAGDALAPLEAYLVWLLLDGADIHQVSAGIFFGDSPESRQWHGDDHCICIIRYLDMSRKLLRQKGPKNPAADNCNFHVVSP